MPLFRRDNNGFGRDSSFGSILTAPFRAFFGFLFGFLGGKDDGLGQQIPLGRRILRGIIRIVLLPLWLTFQFLKFIVLSWTTTRDGNMVLASVIPLLGIMAVGAIMLAANFFENRRILTLYQGRAQECLEVEDYENAVLFSRRGQSISNSDALKFSHALVVKETGLEENAAHIIGEMAPTYEVGYLPAHLYLAGLLIRATEDDPEFDQKLADARQHLERVLAKAADTKDPNYQSAAGLLPKVVFRQGDIKEAMAMYANISHVSPDIVPELARYLLENGDEAGADYHIGRGLEALRRIALVNPNVKDIWILVRDILMVKKEYFRAINELKQGMTLATKPAVKRVILRMQSDVMVEYSRKFTDLGKQGVFREKLKNVCQALYTYPKNEDAIEEFVALILYPENQQISDWLEVEARDHVAPSIYHIINGLKDSVLGKPATGRQHFKLAFQGDSRVAVIVNDLAMELANNQNQPDDALKLIDVAIETWGAASLNQTRGVILEKLGRYEDAIAELDYSMQHLRNSPVAYESLATCYKNVGRVAEAQELETRAEELREEILAENIKFWREVAVTKDGQ